MQSYCEVVRTQTRDFTEDSEATRAGPVGSGIPFPQLRLCTIFVSKGLLLPLF